MARTEYHAAIRRLHLSGAPLRDIAQALALSHQRVQQIVRMAGGSWWTRVWRTRKAGADAICTWCGRPPSEVSQLIAGPNVFICDACVAAAEATAAANRAAPPFESVCTKGIGLRCSFCGKGPSRERRVATARQARICADCVAACRDILDGSRT